MTRTVLFTWKLPKEDMELIGKIAERFDEINKRQGLGVQYKRMTFLMDLECVHMNDIKLDLERLLAAPEFDFMHDILGIRAHINRTTGKLMHCFVPRLAAREQANG